MYKIHMSVAANTDLLEIFDYIAADNVDRAEKFVTLLETEINNLSLFPHRCREYNGRNKLFKNCRMLIVFPYRIFYKIIDDTIYIVQIRHGARKD